MRISLISDTPKLPTWQTDLVSKISELPSVDFVGLMLHEPQVCTETKKSVAHWGTVLQQFILNSLVRLERIKLDKDNLFLEHHSLMDMSTLVSDVFVVDSSWDNSHLSWTLTDKDQRRLRKQDIDLMIVLGSGVLPENFSQVTSMGALSLKSVRKRKGGELPTGFWEVFRKDSRSYFEIIHHSDSTNRGAVIERGSVATQTYFLRNQAHVNVTNASRMVALIEKTGRSGEIPTPEIDVPFTYPLHGTPTSAQSIRYIWMQFSRLFRKTLESVPVSKSASWRVAVARDSWQSAEI